METTQCTFKAPKEWIDEARQQASDKKWSLAIWLREAVEEKLERAERLDAES